MAKARTILQAGKQVAKAVGERVAKGKGLKERPESVLKDPAAQRQGGAKPSSAEAEAAQEPGNPNEIDHGEKQSGQDATG